MMTTNLPSVANFASLSGKFLNRPSGTSLRRVGFSALLLAALLRAAFGAPAGAAAETMAPSLEYQVRASLILNIITFVEWPPSDEAALRICLFGEDNFGSALEILENEIVHGRRIEIQRFSAPPASSTDEAATCDVAYVAADSVKLLDALETLPAAPAILTIGETNDFLARGGIIAILREDKKLAFDVSRPAAARARLVIGSKLLRVARRVEN